MLETIKKFLKNRVVVSILLSLCIFQLVSGLLVPRFKNEEREIRIEATGRKNAQSGGNGVQIQKILVDGKNEILPVDFFTITSWEIGEGGILTWNPFKNRSNVISAKARFRTLGLGLTKESYSGIAKVYVDNTLIKEVDLYSNRSEIVYVDIDGINNGSTMIYILKSVVLFTLLFLISYILSYFFQKKVEPSKEGIIVSVSLGVIASLIYVVEYSTSIQFLKTVTMSISIFILIYVVGTRFVDIDYWYRVILDKHKKLMFSLLILVCILIPIFNTINSSKIINEEVKNSTENITSIPLVSGSSLKQNINILGKAKKIHINIENRDDNEGTFTIRAVQDKKKIEWNLQGVDCNNKDSIELNLTDLSQGDFFLYIDTSYTGAGKGVKVLSSSDTRFGKLEENNNIISDKNLCMSLDLSKENVYYIPQMTAFIFMSIVLLLAVVNVNRCKQNDKLTFILVAIAAFLVYSIKSTMFSLDAQPVHETGSNFFLQTYERGFLGSLFVPDYVYWPLFTRFISDFIVLIFRQRKWAVLLLNCSGGMIAALNCGIINLKVFRINLGKYERFILSLIFGLSPLFVTDELLNFHNSAYWNFILLTLLLTVDWNKMKKYQFILALGSSLMILSKIVFVVMLPVYLIILGFLIIKKEVKANKRLFVYLILDICMTLLSVTYTYILLSRWKYFNDSIGFGERLITVIKQVPLYYFRTLYVPIRYLFNIQNINPYVFVILASAVTVLLVVWISANGIKKYSENKNIKNAWYELMMLFYLLISIATAGILVYTNKDMVINVDTLFTDDFVYGRTNFIIIIEAMIFITMLLRYIFKNKNIIVGIVVSFASLLFLVPFSITTGTYVLSNWTQQYRELYRSSYSIPVVTGSDLFVLKNSYVGYIGGNSNRYTGEYNYIYSSKTIKEIDPNKILYSIDLSDIDKIKNRNILEIYARKSAILQSPESYVLLKDKEGKPIAKVDATYSEDRQALSYFLPDGIKNIGSLEFYYSKDNAPYPLLPEVYLGIEGEYEE